MYICYNYILKRVYYLWQISTDTACNYQRMQLLNSQDMDNKTEQKIDQDVVRQIKIIEDHEIVPSVRNRLRRHYGL